MSRDPRVAGGCSRASVVLSLVLALASFSLAPVALGGPAGVALSRVCESCAGVLAQFQGHVGDRLLMAVSSETELFINGHLVATSRR